MSGPIKSTSWSRLEVFEKCPYRAYLQFVEKRDDHVNVAEQEKRNDARKRGIKVHEDAEKFVRGEIDELPKELKKSARIFEKTRQLMKTNPERVLLEENWGFTADWQTCTWDDWDNCWLRMQADRYVWIDPEQTAAELTDYKTGKKEGNEVKHNQQGQLMVIGSFMRFPSLQVCRVQFEYVDHGKRSLPKTYSREQAMAFLPSFDRRLKAMTNATTFPPKPNRINCAWCPFGPSRGDKSCEYGVEV